MRKLALASILPAALVGMALFAFPAMADHSTSDAPDLNIGGGGDWGGHSQSHCNNLAALEYYPNPLDPNNPNAIQNDTGNDPGNSVYVVNASHIMGQGDSDECVGAGDTGITVITATGYYHSHDVLEGGPLDSRSATPTCAQNSAAGRNPGCNPGAGHGDDGAYLQTTDSPLDDPLLGGDDDGSTDLGQHGDGIP